MARKPTKPPEVPEVSPDALPPPTHNQPPVPIIALGMDAEAWAEHMAHVFSGVDARKAELITSYERFKIGFEVIESTDVQGRAGDLKDKIAAVLKNAKALHEIEKAPILVASRAVDGYLKAFSQPLDAAINVINQRRTAFAVKLEQQARAAAQAEAARRQAEADAAAAAAMQSMETEDLQAASDAATDAEQAAAHAAAPAAEHTRVFGEMGSVSSLRTTWKFMPEDSNLMALVKAVAAGKAPIHFLSFNVMRINTAVRSEALRECPGLAIIQDKKVV
jgi:hypothetical protein